MRTLPLEWEKVPVFIEDPPDVPDGAAVDQVPGGDSEADSRFTEDHLPLVVDLSVKRDR
jgi:hypothetical protein